MPKLASPMPEEQRIELVHGAGEEIDETDGDGADDDERLALEVVAEPAGERGGEHVGEEEPEGDGADCRVGDVELFFDELLDAGEDVAIDVVDEVERGEKEKGEGRSGDGRGDGRTGWNGRGCHLWGG